MTTHCCPPNPDYDCTVDMQEHRPFLWLTLKAQCDHQTSCQIKNSGSIINECREGYSSDYAQIFYDCLPVDETGPVGFTTWAGTGDQTYAAYEIVKFSNVTNNFGASLQFFHKFVCLSV